MKIFAQAYLDTYHLPWSQSIQPADKVLPNLSKKNAPRFIYGDEFL